MPRISQADQLRAYEAEMGISPEHASPFEILRGELAEVRRKLEWRCKLRERALREIVTNANPERWRAVLVELDSEIPDLQRRAAWLERRIARAY